MAASLGSREERSPDRARPRVSLGSTLERVTPRGRRSRCTCARAFFNGPFPEPRPSSRTSSRSSFSSCSFLRSASSSCQPRCCHRPELTSKPVGPSMRPSRPWNAFSAASRFSTAGSHCSLNLSMSSSTISSARSRALLPPPPPGSPCCGSFDSRLMSMFSTPLLSPLLPPSASPCPGSPPSPSSPSSEEASSPRGPAWPWGPPPPSSSSPSSEPASSSAGALSI
mmetsp:Transcript_47113/g.89964  ORF Transcript_47113/g.89964 Transcript_47113/m.89964 type:complete len:225 (-) Transcript_47113:778-1452(-)